jgi:hypothetical protein
VNGDQTVMTEPTVHRSSQPKKRWSDLTSGQQAAIVLGAFAELILTTIALRDLIRRPGVEVRGWKALWAVTFFVQPVGPLMYLRVGRRRSRR